jgi:cardiolipin synthase A/B
VPSASRTLSSRPVPGRAPLSRCGLSRRRLGALLVPAALAACATAPDVDELVSPGQTDQPDPLQAQYALQAAMRDSPLVFGNSTTLLKSAHDALSAMFVALRKARSSINMEYFILDDVGFDGLRLSDVLLSRLRDGVTVNLIYDAYGSRATPGTFFDTLRQAGAHIIEFNPLDPFASRIGWSPNDRDHRKIMVIDGRVAFTGGINFDRVYENAKSAGLPADGDTSRAFWRDIAIRIDGPAVAELQKLFFGTWRAQKGPEVDPARYFPNLPRTGVQTIRIIGSSPGNLRPLYYVSLIEAIRLARSRVWLSSGYFVPPHQERETLYNAARAGIDVRLVLPGHSDVEDAVFAARASYGDLLEAGAKIWEVQDAVLHSKVAVIDGVWTAIGSSNLDRRSVVFNNEVDAIILGRDTASQAETLIQGYVGDAREVTLAAWRNRPFSERLEELEARIWQYWM